MTVTASLGLGAGALVLAAALHAQTYVVDDDGGTGVHYRDLPPAVAAVPDGAVLRVRPGTYNLWSIANKGISVIGDDAASVVIHANPTSVFAWGPTASHQPLRVAHVTLAVSQWSMGQQPLVGVVDARGAVTFDEVHTTRIQPGVTGIAFRFTQCPDVRFRRCTMAEGARWWPFAGGGTRIHGIRSSIELSDSTIESFSPVLTDGCCTGAGGTGLRMESGRATLVSSSVTGGAGSSCVLGTSFAGPGGVGVWLAQSALVAFGSGIRGGSGGSCTSAPSPANGGDALVLTAQSQASLFATKLAGGAASPPALPGNRSTVESGSLLHSEPTATPALARVVGTPAHNAVIQLGVDALAGSAAALFLGVETGQDPLEPLAIGTLLVSPLASFGPFLLPANGQLRVPWTLPASLPLDLGIQGQAVTLEPVSSRLWASNSFVVLIRS